MEMDKIGTIELSEGALEAKVEVVIEELAELQLALVGGGIGDVVGH